MAKECLACGKSMGILTGKVQLADGHVCVDCWSKAGFDNSVNTVMTGTQYDGATIREILSVKEKNQPLIDNFKPTKKVGTLSFDDNTKAFVIRKSKKDADLYYYNQLVDFELLEDGNSITKGGLGRAAVGGLLLGGVGAIVGGVTGGKKTKGICNSLQIKITLRNSPRQTIYIPFITTATKTSSFFYKSSFQSAQDTLSALQLAVDLIEGSSVESQPARATSVADEIMKFKGLLDVGAITQEEFDAKKKQLLSL